MLMKLTRLAVVVITFVAAVAFSVSFISYRIKTDKTIPVITVPDGVYDVSVKATDEELMQGVTAFDEKDGDITNRLLVESISRFIETGYCKVTYAVADSDNHIVTAIRQIHYTDYTPPKFTMSSSLIFSVYDVVKTTGIVGATDCLDGDISNNVVIYSPDYVTGVEGDYTIQATVSNSKGDTSTILLPMSVVKLSKNAPQIELSKYLIYLKKGCQTPDWEHEFIISSSDRTGINAPLKYDVKTDFDPNRSGMYTVNYYGTDEFGATGYTAMIVIVE